MRRSQGTGVWDPPLNTVLVPKQGLNRSLPPATVSVRMRDQADTQLCLRPHACISNTVKWMRDTATEACHPCDTWGQSMFLADQGLLSAQGEASKCPQLSQG